MRKSLTTYSFVILVILIAEFKSNGQNDIKFPTADAVWDINEETYGLSSYIENQIKRYFIDGDTLIDNFKYNKLYSQLGYLYYSFNKPFELIESNNISEPEYFCALRTDSNKNVRAIFTDHLNDKPVTIYNFDLNIDDSIWVYDRYSNDSLLAIVEDIDSVLLNNGEKRKRLLLNGGFNPEYWIEGIGSTHGLFSIFGGECFEYCRFNLYCYKEQSIEVYNTYDEFYNIDYCGLFDGNISKIINEELEQFFQIKRQNSEIVLLFKPNYQKIRLIDIQGKLLSEHSLIGKEDFNILKDNLISNQIIIVQLLDLNNNLHTFKIKL